MLGLKMERRCPALEAHRVSSMTVASDSAVVAVMEAHTKSNGGMGARISIFLRFSFLSPTHLHVK